MNSSSPYRHGWACDKRFVAPNIASETVKVEACGLARSGHAKASFAAVGKALIGWKLGSNKQPRHNT